MRFSEFPESSASTPGSTGIVDSSTNVAATSSSSEESLSAVISNISDAREDRRDLFGTCPDLPVAGVASSAETDRSNGSSPVSLRLGGRLGGAGGKGGAVWWSFVRGTRPGHVGRIRCFFVRRDCVISSDGATSSTQTPSSPSLGNTSTDGTRGSEGLVGVLGALEVVVRVERVENFGGFFASADSPVAGVALLAEADGSNGSSPVSVRVGKGGGEGG